MFHLRDIYQKGSPKITPQFLNYCREQNDLNINRTINYFMKATNYINPQHPFALALDMFDEALLPKDDLITTYYLAREQAPRIANALGFTHGGHVGKIQKTGLTYGSKNEIIVSMSFNDSLTNVIDVNMDYAKWSDLVPVRVIKHPYSDFSYDIPSSLEYVTHRKKRSIEQYEDVKIIHVDLALLFIMYRCWQKSPWCIVDESGDHRTAPNFIGEFVFPRAIRSHMDVVYWNRIRNIAKGLPNDYKPPVGNLGVTTGHVGFVKQQVNQSITQMIFELRKNPEHIKRVLSSLLVLSEGKTVSDLLESHGEPVTHQSTFVHLIPLLDLLETLLVVTNSHVAITSKIKPYWNKEKARWFTSGVLRVYGEELFEYAKQRCKDIEALLN